MKKYIVEAEDPKKGERASSGGIRGNGGRLVSQYTNPVPYREPAPQPAPAVRKQPKKRSWFSGLLINTGKGIMTDMIEMAWDDFGKPILREKITQVENKAIEAWETRKSTRRATERSQEANAKEQRTVKEEMPQDEKPAGKIIQFPSSRVG